MVHNLRYTTRTERWHRKKGRYIRSRLAFLWNMSAVSCARFSPSAACPVYVWLFTFGDREPRTLRMPFPEGIPAVFDSDNHGTLLHAALVRSRHAAKEKPVFFLLVFYFSSSTTVDNTRQPNLKTLSFMWSVLLTLLPFFLVFFTSSITGDLAATHSGQQVVFSLFGKWHLFFYWRLDQEVWEPDPVIVASFCWE